MSTEIPKLFDILALIPYAQGQNSSMERTRMEQLEVFHFDDGKRNFEDYGLTNGGRYWYASDLMRMLGYETLNSFNKAINKAISACVALNIPIPENFIQVKREVDGKPVSDYKLTRFACYLTAMNADARKPQVASAQAYFATLAEAFRQYIQEAEAVERVIVREEISEREKSLSGVAMKAGVIYYGLFQNAGYRGMYNMNLSQLRKYKGLVEGKTLLDFMGKTELAANLFRITQTEEKIKNENIFGQHRLENTAEQVGREVRRTMVRISGVPPEQLPLEGDIKEVRKGLKATNREFKKLDGPIK
jgi:DNA-damage-inducible protein D